MNKDVSPPDFAQEQSLYSMLQERDSPPGKDTATCQAEAQEIVLDRGNQPESPPEEIRGDQPGDQPSDQPDQLAQPDEQPDDQPADQPDAQHDAPPQEQTTLHVTARR